MNLIVTIIGGQTIPNVLFIKHMEEKLRSRNEGFEHFIVSTNQMEEDGVSECILNVCGIEIAHLIEVEAYNLTDVEQKLEEKISENYDKYYVNITGGTKIMSLAVANFFSKKKNARIYYIDGRKSWLIQHPTKKRYSADLSDNISLEEYIKSHGFEIRYGSPSGRSPEETKAFLDTFLNLSDKQLNFLYTKIRNDNHRRNGVVIENLDGLEDFLKEINFKPSENHKLSKYEVRYLTGEWFEEYIYYRLKEEGVIDEGNLETGMHLIKEGVPNEFDVLFLYKTRFYAIECKTSILDDKKQNIINETIYKSTALQKNLGLFSNFSIITLSSRESNEVKQANIDRAISLGIKVFCLEDVLQAKSISEMLKLN